MKLQGRVSRTRGRRDRWDLCHGDYGDDLVKITVANLFFSLQNLVDN